jgi:hypothetical protein
MAGDITYACFDQHAPSIDQHRIDLAEKTIARLLKDGHFRGLESASGPISIHWFREKTARDRVLEHAAGMELESVKGSDRYMDGFFGKGDGSLIHLRSDIAPAMVARVLIHELAHADWERSGPASTKSSWSPEMADDEAWADRTEIRLARYHEGVR